MRPITAEKDDCSMRCFNHGNLIFFLAGTNIVYRKVYATRKDYRITFLVNSYVVKRL